MVRAEVRVSDEPAWEAAAWIVGELRDAIDRAGRAALAVSGGSTAPPLFEAMVELALDWDRIDVWQVDERVAPDGDAARNAGQLDGLRDVGATLHLMPVTDRDLDGAARRYAATLPQRFDVVHLGIGPDGHTASWPPDDPRPVTTVEPVVATAGEFNGWRRMTLTPPVVNAATARAVLTTGADKRDVVARWLAGDDALPVSRLLVAGTVAFLDRAAAPPDAG